MEDQRPILVVEDVPHVRDLLELTLRFQGYRVHAVEDGEEALRFLAVQRPRLIITDILMPRLDGYALAYRLRKDPATREIPIIFISATYVSPEDKAFALSLGAVRFVEKPVDTDEFLLVVAEVLAAQERGEIPVLDERSFYQGHRRRLEAKLRQKSQQLARLRALLPTLSEAQQAGYQGMLEEVARQREAVRAELAQVRARLQALEQGEAGGGGL